MTSKFGRMERLFTFVMERFPRNVIVLLPITDLLNPMIYIANAHAPPTRQYSKLPWEDLSG